MHIHRHQGSRHCCYLLPPPIAAACWCGRCHRCCHDSPVAATEDTAAIDIAHCCSHHCCCCPLLQPSLLLLPVAATIAAIDVASYCSHHCCCHPSLQPLLPPWMQLPSLLLQLLSFLQPLSVAAVSQWLSTFQVPVPSTNAIYVTIAVAATVALDVTLCHYCHFCWHWHCSYLPLQLSPLHNRKKNNNQPICGLFVYFNAVNLLRLFIE